MARIRTVKPELFRHEELFELEQQTKLPIRLSFIALFTACDREGRFKWRPRQLKLDCLPYDEIDFSRVLDALSTRGFIKKYSVAGVDYGVIPSFSRHQAINNRESLSDLPEPPDFIDFEENYLDKSMTCIDEHGDTGRVNDASTTRHDLAQVEGKGREKEGKGNDVHASSDALPVGKKPKTPDEILKTISASSNQNLDSQQNAKGKKAQADKKQKTVIQQDWSPSERCKELLANCGIPESFWEKLIGEFVLYWLERQEKRPGWDSTFLGWVKRSWESSGQSLQYSSTEEKAADHAPKGYRVANSGNYRVSANG